jgi:hypothetical protein
VLTSLGGKQALNQNSSLISFVLEFSYCVRELDIQLKIPRAMVIMGARIINRNPVLDRPSGMGYPQTKLKRKKK